MATSPAFTATPRLGIATLSAANTARDGSGTIVDVFSAGATGSRVEHIDLVARGTTTAGVLRLWIHNGTAYSLWREILVSAITPSTSVAVWSSSVDCSTLAKLLVLPTGHKLCASTHNAEAFNVVAVGGDF